MYRKLFIGAAALSALAVAACGQQDAQDANPGQSAPVNAAQDAMSAPVGQTSAATLGNTTEGFATNAAMSDMYEVQAAKIAQAKASSADVKAYAKMLEDAHTKTTAELKPLAAAANVTLPAELDQRHKGLIDNLNAAAAADFDKTYLDQQRAAHEEALTLFKTYADGGDDAGLKAFATKTQPALQEHLDKANALQTGATPPAK
jgi:putative membrane protein